MTSVTADNNSVLQHFIYTKTISKQSSGIRKLLGTINDDHAIVIIRMPMFNADDAEVVDLIKSGAESNKMFPFILEVICPANKFHIEKHTDKEFVFVRETEAMYRDMTTVYLENHADEHLEQIQWLLNILNGVSEQDSIIYKNADPSNGFVLLPNMNWRSGNTDKPVLDSLNCLAIVNTLGLKTIRDLTASHITLLKNIKEEGIKAIVGKYGVAENQIRIYFHYLPSFYHLHVHFTHINQTLGCNIERAIFLDDVIEMLEENTNAIVEKTMTFALSTNHDLFNYVTTYLNLPSPLKRMTKGIKHAKDSLKLDRMKELKKKDRNEEHANNEDNMRELSSLRANISLSVSDDNDNSIKTASVIVDSKFATPESKKVLPKHLRGIGGKIRNATDSLKLSRTKDVKRIPKQAADNILKAQPTRRSKISNSTDSLKLTRQKDIKRVNANDIFDE